MKLSEILTSAELKLIKYVAILFHGQWVEIDGVRYQPPKERENG